VFKGQGHYDVTSPFVLSMVARYIRLDPAEVHLHPDSKYIKIEALAIIHPEIFDKIQNFVFSRWLSKIQDGHKTCAFTSTHLLHTVITIQKN
jgi:hypothetical protein